MRDYSWMDRAACQGQDTNVFFPVGNQPPAETAVARCARCPVAPQCLDYSLGAPGGHVEWGVWAGMTEDERQQERRRRQRRVGAAG